MIVRRDSAARRPSRRGATTVEFAAVASVVLMLVIGLIVCALGVFRYQEIARLAREGARYASVRGAMYSRNTGRPAATQTDVQQKVILPGSVILDPNKLTTTVAWSPDNQVGSTVTVTLNYQWLPEWLFARITLSSSASAPMTY